MGSYKVLNLPRSVPIHDRRDRARRDRRPLGGTSCEDPAAPETQNSCKGGHRKPNQKRGKPVAPDKSLLKSNTLRILYSWGAFPQLAESQRKIFSDKATKSNSSLRKAISASAMGCSARGVQRFVDNPKNAKHAHDLFLDIRPEASAEKWSILPAVVKKHVQHGSTILALRRAASCLKLACSVFDVLCVIPSAPEALLVVLRPWRSARQKAVNTGCTQKCKLKAYTSVHNTSSIIRKERHLNHLNLSWAEHGSSVSGLHYQESSGCPAEVEPNIHRHTHCRNVWITHSLSTDTGNNTVEVHLLWRPNSKL